MRQRIRVLAIVSVCLLGEGIGRSQQALVVEDIIATMEQKNEQRQHDLMAYTGERTYRVEYHGAGGEHRGELHVRVEYGGHGEKRMTVVSETGSKLICERVLRRMVETEVEASERAGRSQNALSLENYRFELIGDDDLDGMAAWILHVEPRTDNKLMYRGRVWVNKKDYAVMRVQGEPAKSPSWWINHSSFEWDYRRRGSFWLPERSEAVSHVRIGGEAKLTIEYDSYHIVAAEQRLNDGVQTAQAHLAAGHETR